MSGKAMLTPRDWQAMALREAAELAGSHEGAARLVESKRYGALADELDRLRAAIQEALPFTMTAGQRILMAALGPEHVRSDAFDTLPDDYEVN